MSSDAMDVDKAGDPGEDKGAALGGEGDPVVREIDVYLSTTLYERL
jgi:hypothetical protein